MATCRDAGLQADSMAWQIETGGILINWCGPCLRLEAATVRACWTAIDDGVVDMTQSFEIGRRKPISRYDLWFFAPQIRATDFAVTRSAALIRHPHSHAGRCGASYREGVGAKLSLWSEIGPRGITLERASTRIWKSSSGQGTGPVSAGICGQAGLVDILEPRVKILTARVPYLRQHLKEARGAANSSTFFDGPTRRHEYIAR